MKGDEDTMSGEWGGLGRDLKASDPETFDEAIGAVRELVARSTLRSAGNRIACGRLFGAKILRASA